jgi:creatinine amidohydrolase
VAEAIVDELAADFGVLRAPLLPYGVNVPAARDFAGASGLREMTLHSMVNDLLAVWEDHGFAEFILITAHRYDPHVEAIATVSGTRARVRVIEVMELDFSGILDGRGGPEHGGEVMTSLMLYLHPDKVNLGRAEDFSPTPPDEPPPRHLGKLPPLCPGNVGQPTLATREKGEALFELITRKIREKIFLSPDGAR